jgi:hypothetical protein
MAKRFAVMGDLQDHLKRGRLGPFELGVYQIIHWQADFKKGIWWGSAPAIHGVAPRGCSLRDIQRAIRQLTEIGFLVPFHKRGRRGNFPVLIHKYEPLIGALKGKRLNALVSSDWRKPVYEERAENGTENDADTDAVSDALAAPNQYSVCKTQETKEKVESTAPASRAASHPFAEIWNQHCGSLPKLLKLSKGRLQKLNEPR